ncbi:hypothetical protein [Caballeronia sp. DA-9]|uniref:hypothetical protein n=1 Tax=Caballeronia sp. DA-9 TaxID=3436237 RepID=UPI003F680756
MTTTTPPPDSRSSQSRNIKAEPGEPDKRKLTQDPKQTAEVPLGSGDAPEPSGTGGFGSHSSEPEGVSKGTSRKSDLPATDQVSNKPEK